MAKYIDHFNTKATPQTEPVPDKKQVKNSAGGYVFELDKWKRLDRFLIMGCEGGTYYATERKLTIENAKNLLECIQEDGPRVVKRIVEISDSGRAPKNDEALFALALCASKGSLETKKLALSSLLKVARISTHLFQFIENIFGHRGTDKIRRGIRGNGRMLRKAIRAFYTKPDPKDVAYQVCKYGKRGNWSHVDVLRLMRPKPKTDQQKALFRWITHPDGTSKKHDEKYKFNAEHLPQLVHDFQALQKATTPGEVVKLLQKNPSLTWEMIPTEQMKSTEVWMQLLPKMNIEAMMRNLARMTANGTLTASNSAVKTVCEKLSDAEAIKKARLHPMKILAALKTYSQGHGERGKLSWVPVKKIENVLDDAFYLAFKNVEPTGKRYVLALDISGSMSGAGIAGMPGMTARMVSSAMAMVTARTEEKYRIMGFSDSFMELKIHPNASLDKIMAYTDGLPFSRTDCSLPMRWALQNKVEADVFCVYTDNETFAGSIHPFQALRQYRDQMGINAKLVVFGMTATNFTIADPSDAGMMDVVGFDTAVPELLAQFALGQI